MLAPEFLPVWGGVGTYIIGLTRHLPKEVEVHVVTPLRKASGNDQKSTLNYDFSKIFGDNVKIHVISKAEDTFLYNARFQQACFNYVPKLIKDESIDVIHSHTAQMPDLQLMFRKIGIPTVTTVHTTIGSQRLGTKLSQKGSNSFEKSEKATYLLYPALKLSEALYFRRKRVCIAPSFWMKRWLEATVHTNGVIKVIPNCIDIADYKNTNSDKETGFISPALNRKIILYVGRLLAMKGIDTLIDSIPAIIKNTSSTEPLFVFAGPGSVTPYLEKVKKLGIERYCLFLGPLSRESTIQLMTGAELVVVPSFLENCPYVVLESMASGTPVIASEVGGIPELIKDSYTGLLVPPGSSQALTNAISNVLNDKALRNLMSKHARDIVESTFSWKVNIPKYLQVYSEAINNESTSS